MQTADGLPASAGCSLGHPSGPTPTQPTALHACNEDAVVNGSMVPGLEQEWGCCLQGGIRTPTLQSCADKFGCMVRHSFQTQAQGSHTTDTLKRSNKTQTQTSCSEILAHPCKPTGQFSLNLYDSNTSLLRLATTCSNTYSRQGTHCGTPTCQYRSVACAALACPSQ
jgi:hypothetical protein